MKNWKQWLGILSIGVLAVTTTVSGLAIAAPNDLENAGVAPGQQRTSWSFSDAGLIPVQSGGRIKPLDSFARELVLYVSGKTSFQNWNPVDMLFSWVSSPQEWEDRPFVQVARVDVRKQLVLDPNRTLFAPRELFKNQALLQYAERLGNIDSQMSKAPDPKSNPREEELKRLLDRLGTYHGVVSGDAWLVIPQKTPQVWLSLASIKDEKKALAVDPHADAIRTQFVRMIKAYYGGDAAGFATASLDARHAVEAAIPEWSEDMGRVVQAEEIYNRYRPFLFAWIFYFSAALLWLGVIWLGGSVAGRLRPIALGVTALALLIHVAGFGLRCYVAGRPPVSNMYESIVWVSFGAVFFATVIYAMSRQAVLLAVGCSLAGFGLIAANSAPALMDPGIHPLVPVLRSNYWLTIHVLTITLGYAAFALTLGMGNVTLFHFLKGGGDAPPATVHRLNQLTYRAMQFGVVLLAAGTILGGIWADYSWGRFWGWDPKEVWALTALVTYLVILHGRMAGWVGQFGYAAWTVVAFTSVVMAWYGVNFVLGVGLHSYGFSSGGRGVVAAFVGAQLAYVAGVALLRLRKRALAI